MYIFFSEFLISNQIPSIHFLPISFFEKKSMISKRLDRALSQTMYFVDCRELSASKREYSILGNTGNLYHVRIGEERSCTCPDSKTVCKHILFVLVKLLKVRQNNRKLLRNDWSRHDIVQLFKQTPLLPYYDEDETTIMAPETVKQEVETLTQTKKVPLDISKQDFCEETKVHRKATEGEDCCICSDPFKAKERLVWCAGRCGKNIHSACFEKLREYKLNAKVKLTCPLCRVKWFETKTQRVRKRKRNNEGYLNFADITGQSERPEYVRKRRWDESEDDEGTEDEQEEVAL